MTLANFTELFKISESFPTPASFCSQRRLAAFHLRGAGLSEDISIAIARCTSRDKGLLEELPKAVKEWFKTEKKYLNTIIHNIESEEANKLQCELRLEIGQNIIGQLDKQ